MVAWHEVPGKETRMVPSRRERYDLRLYRQSYPPNTPPLVCGSGARASDRTLRDGLAVFPFPGTSYQATIMLSLRDKN